MKTRRKTACWILLGLLLFLCVWLLLPGESPPPSPISKSIQEPANTLVAEIREPAPAIRDTRASCHNIPLIRQLLYRNHQELKVIHRPDGSRQVNLQGQHQHASAAKRLPDGTLVISCFDNAESMLEFMGVPKTVEPENTSNPQMAER